jgi:hypothetical protein
VTSIGPQRSFISVGTSNGFSHPRPGFLRLLRNQGAQVVCSQLTRCCERNRVANRIPIFQGGAMLGLRPARNGVSCRGTMRYFVHKGNLIPDQYETEHRKRVEKLLRPQCLRDVPADVAP